MAEERRQGLAFRVGVGPGAGGWTFISWVEVGPSFLGVGFGPSFSGCGLARSFCSLFFFSFSIVSSIFAFTYLFGVSLSWCELALSSWAWVGRESENRGEERKKKERVRVRYSDRHTDTQRQ